MSEVVTHSEGVGGLNGLGGGSVSKITGAGIGLRTTHIHQVLAEVPAVPWFELLGDNHFAQGGLVPLQVEAIRERYPLTLHFVGMNVAGMDRLNEDYLERVRRLVDICEPHCVSDHLCFTSAHGRHYHDLLPIPYTQEALDHIAARVHYIQEALARPLVLENVSAYLRYQSSALTEAEFIAELVQRTGCGVLLDVNNLYVSHVNHGDDVQAYLDALPMHAVQEVHLAGYEDQGDFLLDAHNNRVSEPVWGLFAQVMKRIPQVPALIEWDLDIPAFSVLQEERCKADEIRARFSRSTPKEEAA